MKRVGGEEVEISGRDYLLLKLGYIRRIVDSVNKELNTKGGRNLFTVCQIFQIFICKGEQANQMLKIWET